MGRRPRATAPKEGGAKGIVRPASNITKKSGPSAVGGAKGGAARPIVGAKGGNAKGGNVKGGNVKGGNVKGGSAIVGGAKGGGKGTAQRSWTAPALPQHANATSGKRAGRRARGGGGGASVVGGGGQQTVKGYAGQRERVTSQRIDGKLVSWKGPFGWIVPSVPVKHPTAKAHGGKVYLDQKDVDQELPGIGAMVSFFVYTDGAGLGAAHCIPAKTVKGVQKTIAKATKQTPSGAANTKANPSMTSKAKAPKLAAQGARGKGKGKGKDNASKNQGDDEQGEKKMAQQAPDKTNRHIISGTPVQGVVTFWKGEVGWIKPDEEVEELKNVKRSRRRGTLYCHATDCEGELPMTNAKVQYYMYSDDHGFGAEGVQVLEQGDGMKQSKETSTEDVEIVEETVADTEGEKARKPRRSRAAKRAAAKAKAVLGSSKFVANVKAKTKGKGKGSARGKAKGKANTDENGEKGPSGPDLPRERVMDESITGEVVSWRGKIGWIKPSEELSLPEAAKHGGKVYVHRKDVIGTESLERGAMVQFNLFKDASGLGAEEVTQV